MSVSRHKQEGRWSALLRSTDERAQGSSTHGERFSVSHFLHKPWRLWQRFGDGGMETILIAPFTWG